MNGGPSIGQRGPILPPRVFDPAVLNRYGESLQVETFEILGLAGGAAGTIALLGTASRFNEAIYLIGVILSSSISANTTAEPRILAIGRDSGDVIALGNARNLFMTVCHQLGTTSTANLVVSRTNSISFQYPFLPRVNTGSRVVAYGSSDLAVGELLYGVATYYYVYASSIQ